MTDGSDTGQGPKKLHGKRDNLPVGVLLVLAGCFMLSTKDATTKLVAAELPVAQVLFLQGAFILCVLLLVAPKTRFRHMFRVGDWKLQAARAGLVIGNMFLFVSGLQQLPFSIAVTLAFVNPLYVTALAPLLLGERVGALRWMAVLFGFSGVLLITAPTESHLTWAVLLPLSGAFFGALRDIVTRHMTPTETSEAMLFYAIVAITVFGFIASIGNWQPISRETAIILLISAIAQMVSLYLMIEAYQYAEAAIVAPFKYSLLVWVVTFDLLIWGNLPSWNLFAGAAIIITAILFIYHRERRLRVARLDRE